MKTSEIKSRLEVIFEHGGYFSKKIQVGMHIDLGYTNTAKVLFSLGSHAQHFNASKVTQESLFKGQVLNVTKISKILKELQCNQFDNFEHKLKFVQDLVTEISMSPIVTESGMIICGDYQKFQANFIQLSEILTDMDYLDLTQILCQFHSRIVCTEELVSHEDAVLCVEFDGQQIEKDLHRLGNISLHNGSSQEDLAIGKLTKGISFPSVEAVVQFLTERKLDKAVGVKPLDLAVAISVASAQSIQEQVMKVLGQVIGHNVTNSRGEGARRKRLHKGVVEILKYSKVELTKYNPEYQAKIEFKEGKALVSILDLEWGFPYSTEVAIDLTNVKFNYRNELELLIAPGDVKIKRSLLIPRLVSNTYDHLPNKPYNSEEELLNIWDCLLGKSEFGDSIANLSKIHI